MKKILILFWLWAGVNAWAQNCSTCFQNPQQVIITTQPGQATGQPVITDACRPKYQNFYQKNRFQWYFSESVTQYWYKARPNTGIGGTATINPLLVPSLNSAVIEQYKYLNKEGGTVPDNQPQDGWELVKQDLGFLNYNNYLGNTADYLSPNDDNDGDNGLVIVPSGPRCEIANTMYKKGSPETFIPYIILYNRFSGTLRVMG
ncbi:MAG TPA: hypothetical protein PKY12_08660 [Catalimonadaceae bacterium]|nr:hypothetical protein [Catalimonadaceae bacterium]